MREVLEHPFQIGNCPDFPTSPLFQHPSVREKEKGAISGPRRRNALARRSRLPPRPRPQALRTCHEASRLITVYHRSIQRATIRRRFSPLTSASGNHTPTRGGNPPAPGLWCGSPTRPPATGRATGSGFAGHAVCCSSGESPHTPPAPSQCSG